MAGMYRKNMSNEFHALKALVDDQLIANVEGYLGCKSYDTIEIETEDPEFDFLRMLPFSAQNCLLIRVAVAILRPISAFLDVMREERKARIFAMAYVTDWQRLGRDTPYEVDGSNGRLNVAIWCGNFANPMLGSFAPQETNTVSPQQAFVASCLADELPDLMFYDVIDHHASTPVVQGVHVRLRSAIAPWEDVVCGQ